MRTARDWLCYQIVILWPTWGCINPLGRKTWGQRASWWVHERILPHAGSWAYRDEMPQGTKPD